MKAKVEVLKTKVTGNFRLAVTKKTYADGRVTFGFATVRRGGTWGVEYGHNEKTAGRLFKKHNAALHNPNILYCG